MEKGFIDFLFENIATLFLGIISIIFILRHFRLREKELELKQGKLPNSIDNLTNELAKLSSEIHKLQKVIEVGPGESPGCGAPFEVCIDRSPGAIKYINTNTIEIKLLSSHPSFNLANYSVQFVVKADLEAEDRIQIDLDQFPYRGAFIISRGENTRNGVFQLEIPEHDTKTYHIAEFHKYLSKSKPPPVDVGDPD